MKKSKIILLVLLVLAIVAAAYLVFVQNKNLPATESSTPALTPLSSPTATPSELIQPTSTTAQTNSIIYKNTNYGFSFTLPLSWKDYTIVTDKWQGEYVAGSKKDTSITGPLIYIRHPKWTSADPRQDIPIMIFTLSQWASIQNEDLAVGAAPIGPTELGRNSKYVFALPARYNYAFPTGYEEVEEIMNSNPLQAN